MRFLLERITILSAHFFNIPCLINACILSAAPLLFGNGILIFCEFIRLMYLFIQMPNVLLHYHRRLLATSVDVELNRNSRSFLESNHELPGVEATRLPTDQAG